MVLNREVRLPEIWIEKSRQFAERMVANYATSNDPRIKKSRDVSCFDAQSNINLQSQAKMAECAFAIFAGIDPAYGVHWESHPDNGADLVWGGKRWDVKNTRKSGQYLLWPIAKNHIYHSKHFDALVLVKHELPNFQIYGWISKADFFNRKSIATDEMPPPKIFPGTWYMHQSDIEHFWEQEAA